jgi:hypothetical protein
MELAASEAKKRYNVTCNVLAQKTTLEENRAIHSAAA